MTAKHADCKEIAKKDVIKEIAKKDVVKEIAKKDVIKERSTLGKDMYNTIYIKNRDQKDDCDACKMQRNSQERKKHA